MSLFELPNESGTGLLDGSLEFSPDNQRSSGMLGGRNSRHKSSMSTAAPLEQHIKQQICDGVKYKVVREDVKPPRPGTDEAQVFKERIKTSIKDSRVAELQKRQRQLQALKTKERGVPKKMHKKAKSMAFGAFAIKAGNNAANQENLAEDRYFSKMHENREYDQDVKRRVNERMFTQAKRKDAKEKQYAEELRKFIYETVEYIYNDRLRWPNRKVGDKAAKKNWLKVAEATQEMDRQTQGSIKSKGSKKTGPTEEQKRAELVEQINLGVYSLTMRAQEIQRVRNVMCTKIQTVKDHQSTKRTRRGRNRGGDSQTRVSEQLLDSQVDMTALMGGGAPTGWSKQLKGKLADRGNNQPQPDDPVGAEPDAFKFSWTNCGQTNKNLDWHTNDKFATTKYSKRPLNRQSNAPMLMKRLEILLYDNINPEEDMQAQIDRLKVNVADNILTLCRKWKLNEELDQNELKRLIRYQLILELTKLENRKDVKRIQRDKVYKEEQDSDDEEQVDDGGTDKTNMSPKRGRGYDNTSLGGTSSPFKGSVTKTMRTGKWSETDTVGTATTMQTGATQKAGGLQDLLKIPDMSQFPSKKAKGGGGGGGLSQGNAALSRMSRAGSQKGAASQATKSRAGFSQMSKRSGVSGSRKSQREPVYEDMEPEQLEAELDGAEAALKQCEIEFVKQHKLEYNPKSTAQQSITQGKVQKLKPLEDEIKAARAKVIMLLILMMNKTDAFEKLPKDHQFYLHYGQKNAYSRIANDAEEELKREEMNYRSAKENLAENAARRNTDYKNKKLVPYV